MNAVFGLGMGVLVLGASLLLSGCEKSDSTSTKDEGPKGNPIMPAHGQRLEGGGAIQNVRQAARRTADLGQLKNFALAYFQYRTLNNRSPSRLEDIKESLDADSISAFKEGFYVAVWNARGTSGDTIIAYVKDPDSYGTRIVGSADGGARRLNKDDFEAALKNK